jgi:hypothetical protein
MSKVLKKYFSDFKIREFYECRHEWPENFAVGVSLEIYKERFCLGFFAYNDDIKFQGYSYYSYNNAENIAWLDYEIWLEKNKDGNGFNS